MKSLVSLFTLVLLLCAFTGVSQAVLGIPDHVPAATLIVPMFEVGIDSSANPNDTLTVVWGNAATTVHYEVWDIEGDAVNIYGDFSLGTAQSIPFSMRGLISTASPAAQAMLTDGAFYRGFITFDAVTAPTFLRPIDAGYPFSSANILEGYIYYTRLTQGSSNGISMVPLEATPGGTSYLLQGFYQSSDDREEIDADARYSAELMSHGLAPASNPNGAISRIHSRLYQVTANNAYSKVVVFTFPEGGWCLPCGPGTVALKWYCEDGSLVLDTTYNLTNVVNIITTTGGCSGTLSLWNIPAGWETYAFSMNSASPGFDPALTWDAIFESFITP